MRTEVTGQRGAGTSERSDTPLDMVNLETDEVQIENMTSMQQSHIW